MKLFNLLLFNFQLIFAAECNTPKASIHVKINGQRRSEVYNFLLMYAPTYKRDIEDIFLNQETIERLAQDKLSEYQELETCYDKRFKKLRKTFLYTVQLSKNPLMSEIPFYELMWIVYDELLGPFRILAGIA